METPKRFESPDSLVREQGFTRLLLESMPDGIVACDADGRLILFNPVACEWFQKDLTGLSLKDWTKHDDLCRDDGFTPLPAEEAPLARAFRGERFSGAGAAIVASGKPARFLRVSGGPVMDAAGRKLGAAVVMRDVTEIRRLAERTNELEKTNRNLRAELEEQKREQEQAGNERALLRCILDSANDLIFIKDQNSVYRGCNRASEQFLGISESNQIGKTDFDFFDREMAEVIREADRRVMKTGKPVHTEDWVTYADGHKALMDTVKVPYHGPGGELLGLVGIARDITERIQKEKALKKSEAKYLDLYDNAPDMYASADTQTTLIEECNMTLTSTLGYSKEDIIGRPLFDIFHPDCLKEAKQVFSSFLRTGRVYDKELQLQRKNGSKLDISLNASAVYDKNGQIIFIRSTLHDITEHKRNNAINSARLRLLQFAAAHSLDELLEQTTNEAEKLSDSLIGFYYIAEDDQKYPALQSWSERTKTKFCKMQGKKMHDPIAQAGVWANCVHQGKPVIHNDYAALIHRKDMPKGHAEVIRELVVPVFRGNAIKAVLGVGNKPVNYTEKDMEAISLLADLSWEIVERKRAEEKALRSDQRLRLHSEQSPLGFLEWDDKFRAVEWNAACERIFSYTREEAIGRHAKDLILPIEVHEMVDGIFHSLMSQTGGQHSINENVTKDGRTIICEWFNTTLVNESGKAIGVASICRDITEQKRIEAELANYREDLEQQVIERTAELEIARNKAQQYLDIAGVILLAIDKTRKVTLINQKGCDVLGHASSDIIGKDWFKTFVPENVRRDVIQGYVRLMAGDPEPVEYFENPVVTQTGEERLVAWHNVLLRDNNGNITGTLSSGEDITEKKHAEEQIIRLNQDLRLRAAALEEANRELEAFAYSVSHDLRAPLRHINGFLELLKKRIRAALDKQSRHYMEVIADATAKMGRLIDDLLSFSRMGRHSMSFRPVLLKPLVRDIIRELEVETAGRDIEWRLGDLPTVDGDAAMLRIVLVNLISNALKFTRLQQRTKIEIGTRSEQTSETVIFVRDNGVGFDMTYADKLFGVFQRLHKAEEFEGCGIGLATVHRIIARHGGRTWAQAIPDQGAVFYFTLPRNSQKGKSEKI